DRARQIKINEFAARRADRVIVTVSLAVVTARALAKRSNLANQPRVFQIPQCVVNGGEADAWHLLLGPLENFGGGRMLVPHPHQLQHEAALSRQTRTPLLCLR